MLRGARPESSARRVGARRRGEEWGDSRDCPRGRPTTRTARGVACGVARGAARATGRGARYKHAG
eukprot:2057748-Alexandrium_andersonii.AAC.1